MKGQNKFLIAATFSLLSFGVIAGESYTCELDAKKTKNWIPSSIQISFNDDRELTRLSTKDDAYPKYDVDQAKVLRYTKDFREVKYVSVLETAGTDNNRKIKTIHTITILPKIGNKIRYMMKFGNFRNHYEASGTCKKNN